MNLYKIGSVKLKLFLYLFLSVTVFFSFTIDSLKNIPFEEMEDHILVVRNNSIVFDVLENDNLETKIEDVSIFSPPEFGQVKLNSDFTFTFKPNKDICEQTDSFLYFIKKGDKLDTINVKVDIICENLTFLSGFSPDGDSVNDTYYIIGAETYPNNSLVVFNKWGEEVYSAIGYKNDWNGVNKEGELLTSEDNVYYYVFNDGEGNSYSGYLKIE